MHRFLVESDALHGAQVVLPPRVSHQICKVLRMQPGDHILVLDGSGWEMEVALVRVNREEVVGELLDRRLAGGEPRVHITLCQSLLKQDRFEWVLQKCTEIGVGAFVPMISQRTVVREVSAVGDHKLTRWKRVVAESVEQSRRGRVPVLHDVIEFRQAVLRHGEPSSLSLIPWEEERGTGLRTVLARAASQNLPVGSWTLFIGPEGGFGEDEVAFARDHGVVPVTLGPRILRAETAAVVAASLVLYELDDL